MRLSRRALRVALPVAAATTVLAAGTGTAAADVPGPGLVARARMTLYVQSTGVSFCVHGELGSVSQITGMWTFRMAGVRGFEVYAPTAWTSSAAVVDHCEFASIAGYTTGDINAEFNYTGVGNYVTGRSVGAAVWDPTIGTRVYWFDSYA